MKRLTPVAVTLATLLFAVPAVAGQWSQVGHDAANSSYASGSTIRTSNVRNLSEVWARSFAGSAVAVGGRVFVDPPGNHPLSILNLATGATIGTIADGRFEGPPAVAGGVAVVQRRTIRGTNGTILHRASIGAFRISNGQKLWVVPAGVDDNLRAIVPPTIAKGVVFPGGRGKGRTRPAIARKGGHVLYRTTPGGPTGTKVVVGSGMVVTASGNQIRAFRARTGKFVWRAVRTDPSLTLLGPRLIVTGGGSIAGFDVRKGKLLWRVTAATVGGVTVINKLVVGAVRTSGQTMLRGWSSLDGHTRWQRHIGAANDRFTDPVLVNGVVLIGWRTSTQSKLIAARRTSGGRLATLSVGNGAFGGLTVINDTVLVPIGGTLHALRIP